MESEREAPAVVTERGLTYRVGSALGLFAAVLAMVLVILGIGALAVAIIAAWSLYETPSGIDPYASYFAGLLPGAVAEEGTRQGLGKLVAWVFVVLMLLVLGKLGSWAVGAGSLLVRPRAARRD